MPSQTEIKACAPAGEGKSRRRVPFGGFPSAGSPRRGAAARAGAKSPGEGRPTAGPAAAAPLRGRVRVGVRRHLTLLRICLLKYDWFRWAEN